MNKLDITAIIEWHKKNFKRAKEDFLRALFKQHKEKYLKEENIEVLADLFITACGIARFNAIEAMFCFSRIEDMLCGSYFATCDLTKVIQQKIGA